MAAPVHSSNGITSNSATSGTSFSVAWSTASTDDVGLLMVTWQTNASWSGTPGWCTVDQGWVELTAARTDANRSSYRSRTQLFWKRHSGSETDPTITLPNADTANDTTRGKIVSFSGAVATGDPFDTVVSSVASPNGFATTFDAPAGTAAGANDSRGIAVQLYNSLPITVGTATVPSGWTERLDTSSGTGALGSKIYLATYDSALTSGGNAPAVTVTYSHAPASSSTLVSYALVIRSLAIAGSLAPTAGSIPASGQSPNLTFSWVLSPNTGMVGVTGSAPDNSLVGSPQLGGVAAAGSAPELSVLSGKTPETGTVLALGQAPGVTFKSVLFPEVGEGNTQGFAPNSSLALNPDTGTPQGVGTVPTLDAVKVLERGEVLGSGQIPAASLMFALQPGQIGAQATPANLSQTSQPAEGLVRAAGEAPALSISSGLTPETGVASAVGVGPALTLASILVPQPGAAEVTGSAPAQTQQCTPLQGIALWSGANPGLTLQAENTPATGLASSVGQVPGLSQTLRPSRGTADAVGNVPGLGTGLELTPQPGAAQVSGVAPILGVGIGPASGDVGSTGAFPALVREMTLGSGGVWGSGPTPGIALSLSLASGDLTAPGQAPEKFVGRFLIPEAGIAPITAGETATLGRGFIPATGFTQLLGASAEVLLTVPGNRRAVAFSRLFARLSLLTPSSGILVLRNPTVAFTPPPAGAVVMLDADPGEPDRGQTFTLYTHSVRLELFLPMPSLRSMADLEEDVASVLRTDRTLSGTIEQMFFVPTGEDIASGGGPPTIVSTIALRLTYAEELQ